MTNKKKTVKITAVIASVILCVAYFAMMSPTTAYFYKADTSKLDVTFSLFDVSQNVLSVEDDLVFKATTEFYDFDEFLFDEVIITKEATVTNTGEAAARIYTRVVPDNTGLKYIYFAEKVSEEAEEKTAQDSSGEKGPIKTKIENTLNTFNSSFIKGISKADANTVLDNFNKKNDSEYVTVEKGESAKVTVILWADYETYKDTLNAKELTEITAKADIKIIATQDSDGAIPA